MKDTIQQIKDLVDKSKNILVITKKEPSGDSVGSMLGLYLALAKMEKNVQVVSHGSPDMIYKFLPSFYKITKELESTKNFIISLDVRNAQVGEFSYKIEGDKLNIYIEPKDGEFTPEDVNAEKSKPKFDLVLAINCPDLEYMGKLYEENTEFFYETPIINIDHRASNENYGQVNLIDITATSTAEILFDVLSKIEENLIDEDIATCLLTGIIYDTDSFQSQSTTPKAFQVASELVSLGADQQKIIQHLYKTKSLATLKLWGRLLARIKHDPKSKLVWTLVDISDFEKSGSSPKDIEGIAKELISTSPDAEVILILARTKPKTIKGFIYTTANEDASKFAALFGGKGTIREASFITDSDNLIETEKDVVETIKTCRK